MKLKLAALFNITFPFVRVKLLLAALLPLFIVTSLELLIVRLLKVVFPLMVWLVVPVKLTVPVFALKVPKFDQFPFKFIVWVLAFSMALEFVRDKFPFTVILPIKEQGNPLG